MVNYTKELLKGSVFVFLMSILAGFIAYFTRIILARNLSPTEYGLFYSIFAFVSLFLFFRDFGLNQALPKFIAEFNVKKQYEKIKTSIFATFVIQTISTIVLSILLYVSSDFLGTHYFKDVSASPMIKIFILYVFFSMLVLLISSIFQGHKNVVLFYMPEPLTNLFTLIFVIIAFNMGIKAFAPSYAYTLSWFVVFLVLLPFLIKLLKQYSKYHISDIKNSAKNLLSFGLPVMLTKIGSKVISRIDTLTLVYFTTLANVGIYNVVLPTAMFFLAISDSISNVSFPMISELWAKKDKKRLNYWITRVYRYSLVFLLPMLMPTFAFSDILIRLFFGEAYAVGVTALRILLIASLFYSIARLTHTTLSAIGKPEIVTKVIITAAILNFIGNVTLIPRFGIEGAALSTALSYLIVLISSIYFLNKFIKTKLPFMPWIKTFFAALFFTAAIYLVKNYLVLNNIWLELGISLFVGTIVYTIAIFWLKLINIDEIKQYIKFAL